MAPPSKARPRVAYDLGRRGEAMPDDWRDDYEMAGAYEMGVDDRDASAAGSPRRHGPPKPRRSAENDDSDASGGSVADEADSFSKSGKGAQSRSQQGLFAGPSETAGGITLRGGKGSTGGGLFLGIIGYCMGRALITEGPHGIWRWYSAKFMNNPLPRGGTTTRSPAAPAGPTTSSGQRQPTPQPAPTPSAATSTGPGRVITA